MANSGVPHEVELKLRVSPAAAALVPGHPALASLKRGRVRQTRLRSIYFDTQDRSLARAGVAVRLRKSGRTWLQTVKGSATQASGGGLADRVETEWRLRTSASRPPLDFARLAQTPFRRIIEQATRHAALVPLFETDIARSTIALEFADSTTAQLCLDRGVVRAMDRTGPGAGREPISEIELELVSGNAARLFELAAALSADLAISVEPRSKAHRGYALLAPLRNSPVRADPVEIPGEASAAQALAVILRSCLRQVDANADGVRFEDDPEWIHQMRVGVRRLRLALALVRKMLPPGTVEPLANELRWLAEALGRARDLDVFIDDVAPAIARAASNSPPQASAIDLLVSRVRMKATETRRAAQVAIASARFVRIQLATGWLAAMPRLGARVASPEADALAAPAQSFAADLLKRRHRKLVRAGAHLADGTAEDRHQTRIETKKLRYAAEFLAGLFDGKRATAYRRALLDLQEELGMFNDASVAAALALDLCGAASPAAALVAGWAAARCDARKPRLLRAWRDFTRAEPFWKEH